MDKRQPTQFLLYKSENDKIKVDVLIQDEMVWLTIEQMAELFGKGHSTINDHILNIYQDGELEKEESMRKIGISDFSTKPLLDFDKINQEAIKLAGAGISYPQNLPKGVVISVRKESSFSAIR